MNWLREAISDQNNFASTKRIVMLMAGFALSISTSALVVAVFFGFNVEGPLVAFGTSLAAMAGGGYAFGKKYEQRPPE